MLDSVLNLNFIVYYAPLPSVLRSALRFEEGLKGTFFRKKQELGFPFVLNDQGEEYQITITPESFSFRLASLKQIELFQSSALSFAWQFLEQARLLSLKEVELRALLRIPLPPQERLHKGYTSIHFSWPKKCELRTEALGKDHYFATQTGIIHLRLRTISKGTGHELELLLANRHDYVSSDLEAFNQAFLLCLQGLIKVIHGIGSRPYQQALQPFLLKK